MTWVVASESDTDRVWYLVDDSGKWTGETRYEFFDRPEVVTLTGGAPPQSPRRVRFVVAALTGAVGAAAVIELLRYIVH